MTDPFGPALQTLTPGDWSCTDPIPFRSYLTHHGLPARETAQLISVDHLEHLAPSLRAAGAMVLRLGQGTFALIGTPGRLADFFLHHSDLFAGVAPEPFPLDTGSDILTAYRSLGVLTEPSLVHLAFASGLLGHALDLSPWPREAPATGASTYAFQFRPHSAIDRVFTHTQGQVEVDAAFIGRRHGRPVLFVLEAKCGGGKQTLAKHKLLYPALAVAPHVPAEIPIIPVFLYIDPAPPCYRFHVVECSLPDPRTGIPALDELTPLSHRCLRMEI